MNAWLDGITGSLGPTAPFLFDVGLKSAAILGLALALTGILREASASARHRVWTVAFAAVLVLPALAVCVPSWQVSLPGWAVPVVASGATDAGGPAAIEIEEAERGAFAADAVDLASFLAPGSFEPADRPRRAAPVGAATRPEVGDAVTGATPVDPDGAPLRGTLFLVWLVGAGALLARLAVGVVAARRTTRRARPVGDPAWTVEVERLRRELDIGRPVQILESARVTSPMAWGLVRSALLLPSTARGWSARRRRAVLLHELAHIRRRDCVVHVLAEVARALHWANPLAWFGVRRLRSERERACDDLVLAHGTRGPDYAQLLLDLARGRGDRRLARATVSMARPSELEGRLLAILDPDRDRRGPGKVATAALGLLFAGLTIPLAAFQAAPSSPEGPPPPASPEASPPAAADADPPPSEGGAPPAALEPAAGRAGDLPRILPPVSAPPPDLGPRWSGIELAIGRDRGPSLGTPRPLRAPRAERPDTLEERVIEAMLRALGSDRPSFRAEAASALGRLEDDRPSILDALGSAARGDESAEVRSAAAWALGMIESGGGVEALAAALEDPEVEVRSQAAWGLGMIESEEGVSPLVASLGDADADVRAQAAWALGMIESPAAVDGLLGALRDESVEVRSQAAWALGMIGERRAADALVDALEDESEEVAEQAMWALSQVLGG